MIGDQPSDPNPTARVLSFRRMPAAARGHPPGAAPGPHGQRDVVPDLADYHSSDGPDDYRHRMIVNVAAFAVLIALIFAGYWLADTMARMRKDQDCVLSGRRGCAPIPVIPQNRG